MLTEIQIQHQKKKSFQNLLLLASFLCKVGCLNKQTLRHLLLLIQICKTKMYMEMTNFIKKSEMCRFLLFLPFMAI